MKAIIRCWFRGHEWSEWVVTETMFDRPGGVPMEQRRSCTRCSMCELRDYRGAPWSPEIMRLLGHTKEEIDLYQEWTNFRKYKELSR